MLENIKLFGSVNVEQEKAQRFQELRETREALRRKVFCKFSNICIKRSYLGLARSLCSVSYCIITILGLFVQDS